MTTPPVTVTLAGTDDAYIVKNLYPLYVHDLAAFHAQLPNPHGILDDSPGVRSLSDFADTFDLWWQKPGILFPYLIRVNDAPAGFAMIASPPHVAAATDFLFNEFFLLHPYRGTGAAHAAATDILSRHAGHWHAYVLPANARALAFWRRTLRTYPFFEERVGQTILGSHNLHTFSFITPLPTSAS
jgi:aminoglycoside 6'-N-acetyltransferase I